MTTYNGWRNRPTWNAHLWLSNDEPLYRSAMTIANSRPDGGKITLADAADGLRELCFEIWPSRRTPDGDDLFAVNWRDVARAFRE